MKCKPELFKCEHCKYKQRIDELSYKCLIHKKDHIDLVEAVATIEAIANLKNLKLNFEVPEEK